MSLEYHTFQSVSGNYFHTKTNLSAEKVRQKYSLGWLEAGFIGRGVTGQLTPENL